MTKRKLWIPANPGKSKTTLNQWDKIEIENSCQPLVKKFKEQFIKENPDKRFNYLVDVYIRWRGDYLYFCEKFKPARLPAGQAGPTGGSESPDRIADEFEIKFVRLEYVGKDSFNFSYFRHTGQWFLVATTMSLNDCLEMMQDNPNFQPVG